MQDKDFLEDLLKNVKYDIQNAKVDIVKSLAMEHEKKVGCDCFICSSLRFIDGMIEQQYMSKSSLFNDIIDNEDINEMIEMAETDIKEKRLELHVAFASYSGAKTLYNAYKAKGAQIK